MNTINLQPLPQSRRYVLTGDVEVSGHVVPNGFQTNGASIPRPFWFIVGSPYAPEVIHAALVHDWLYLCHAVDRTTADDIFYERMIADGVLRWRALIMRVAVRIFGGMAW